MSPTFDMQESQAQSPARVILSQPEFHRVRRDLQETTPSASKCTGPRSGETEGVSETHMGLVAKDRPKDCGSEEAVSGSTWTSLSNLALEFGEMGVQIDLSGMDAGYAA
ncbi:hypothetical protein SCLCIDRAFT_29053 [Scleroderma citrinum Foug A]|uniref:Uncharacterized protein n=1 Tax=Scleroderma citrinum Foug A TaxID=1036808 RepID=A0A0C2Z5J9_9AGAM|nr:hypothetical protein SCLCIDRAFT_29053 [Scleroderma citrinum Foug A]